MIILSIETSCDETSVAVVKAEGGLNPPAGGPRFEILSNVVSSQIKVHAPFGGVVPTLAKREHQKNLVPVLARALKEAGLVKNSKSLKSRSLNAKRDTLNVILEREPELLEQFKKRVLPLEIPKKIDAVAVTAGPGLEPALWVGVNFARALSFLWEKPLIAANHVEGHLLANWLSPRGKFQIAFPALCLVASGGHTQLILAKGLGKYKVVGETRDDAAGEAFDKAAKMLNLGFPGGPAVSREAAKLKIKNEKLKIKLPRPMINSGDYDFSFSGLKTALLYLIGGLKEKGYPLKKIRPALCAEFQNAAIDVLITKTLKAAKNFKVKSVLLGGGVAANRALRGRLESAAGKELPGIHYRQPKIEFTGDNAAMIAAAAYVRLKAKKLKLPTLKKEWKTLKAKADWRI